MKHLSLLLTLLLCALGRGAAWADGLPKLSTDSEKHYYLLRSAYTGEYVTYTGDGPKEWTTARGSGSEEKNVFYFTAESDVATDGKLAVRIHNLASEKVWNSFGDWTTDGADWVIASHTYDGRNGITIAKVTDSKTDYLDYSGSQATNGIHFDFIETTKDNIGEPAEKITALQTTLANTAAVGTNVGTYISGCLPAALEALQTYDATYSAFYKATRNLPVSGHYYYIANAANTGKYIQESYTDKIAAGNNKLACTSLAANTVPALWKFVPCTTSGSTDLFYIEAANTEAFFGLTEWNYIDGSSGVGGVHVVSAVDDANIGIYDLFDKTHVTSAGSATIVHYTNADRSTDHRGTLHYSSDSKLASWNGTEEGLNNWNITEVTQIGVAIGSTGYATINLPFAVTIPDGVNAYTGTANTEQNVMTLTELSGIIPANTPVILTASANTSYTFNIDYDNTSAAPANDLIGTLAPADIASTATAYTLRNSASQGIGLYKVTSETDRTIPANKAYYGSLTGSAASQMLSFAFAGDNTTGIHSANVQSAANGTYYDLNGRRVLFPSHGVYVNSRGEKVFIK